MLLYKCWTVLLLATSVDLTK